MLISYTLFYSSNSKISEEIVAKAKDLWKKFGDFTLAMFGSKEKNC